MEETPAGEARTPSHPAGRARPPSAAVPERLRTFARWMDTALRIPGTRIRVGLDSLVGLVPGVGDLAGGALALYPIVAAARLGAPPSLLLRMGLNVGLDALVGSVPLLGDVFDVAFKANRRNVRLLERHLEGPVVSRRASRGVVAAVVALAVLALVGAVALGVAAARALAALLG